MRLRRTLSKEESLRAERLRRRARKLSSLANRTAVSRQNYLYTAFVSIQA